MNTRTTERGQNGRPTTEMVLGGQRERDEVIERVVVGGDLERLNPAERTHYYLSLCESMGLDARLRPLEYLKLDGKLTLYVRRQATDQLRAIHGVSVRVTNRERVDDVYIVTAEGKDRDGRTDESTGAVALTCPIMVWDGQRKAPKRDKDGEVIMRPLRADEMANAVMKAETKAKRRVTLSLCGLGMSDESEVADMANAEPAPRDISPPAPQDGVPPPREPGAEG